MACACTAPSRVTVRDGEVVEAVTRGAGCGQSAAEHAPTIEGVFEVAADNRPGFFDDDVDVEIVYDHRRGFPLRIDVTCGQGSADCGSAWRVEDFEPGAHVRRPVPTSEGEGTEKGIHTTGASPFQIAPAPIESNTCSTRYPPPRLHRPQAALRAW
ncbi:DUF6174 domain-containing protein [Nocardioides sp.]|uniref:DUF6174 domain-containing protein n=1 Tax=Nocardioides sp. TaxID=35761 RepID=UPI0039C8CA8F